MMSSTVELREILFLDKEAKISSTVNLETTRYKVAPRALCLFLLLLLLMILCISLQL